MFDFFRQAFFWNILNVFLYKIMLQIHLALLLYYTSPYLFGAAGTIFSGIYFIVSITNFGFDSYMIAHYKQYSVSQQSFKNMRYWLIARLGTILASVVLLYKAAACFQQYKPITLLSSNASGYFIGLVTFIFITESIKKSLDIIAQMSFLQKSITFLDIGSLCLYIAMVWTPYVLYGTITLTTIFTPMAITSFVECCMITVRLFRYYQALPKTDYLHTSHNTHYIRIIQQLSIHYINQITKALFSPNFFIILLAYTAGFSKAGYIKLFTDIIVLMYMLLNKCCGLPSAALFSAISKQLPYDHKHLQETFLKLTNWYVQFLYAGTIITISTIVPCLVSYTCISSAVITNITLFIFAGFIEYFLITYEKWYITQNAAWIMATLNAISLIPTAFIIYHINNMNPFLVILPLVCLRLLVATAIVYLTYRIWHMMPSWSIKKTTLYITLLSIFFIIILMIYQI